MQIQFWSCFKSLLVFWWYNGSMSCVYRCETSQFSCSSETSCTLTLLSPSCTFTSMDEVRLNHGVSNNTQTVCFTLHTLHTVHRADITCSDNIITYFKLAVLNDRPDTAEKLWIIHSSLCMYVQFVHFYNGPIIKYTYNSLLTCPTNTTHR